MIYLGNTVFRGIQYSFGFDGRELELSPMGGWSEAARNLTMARLGNGVWGYPGDKIDLEKDYLVLSPKNADCTIIAFPLWDQFVPSNSFKGAIKTEIAAYSCIMRENEELSGLLFRSPILNRCLDVQQIVARCNASDFRTRPVRLKQANPIRCVFVVNGVRIRVLLGHVVTTVSKAGAQPLSIESEMRFEFDATTDYSLIADLLIIARQFLVFCTQTSGVDYQSISLLCQFDDESRGSDDAVSTSFFEAGELTREIDAGKGDSSNRCEWFIPLGQFEGLEESILQALADDSVILRHLPTIAEANHISDARCILLASAFDREIGVQYPNGIPHDEESEKAVAEIDAALQKLQKNASRNSKLYKKTEWLRNVLANGDQFSAKLLQFYKDHPGLAQALASYGEIDKKSFNQMTIRVQKLRNALAHGSMDVNYDEELMGDIVYLNRIVMAIQLLNITTCTDEQVASIVKKTFGLHW